MPPRNAQGQSRQVPLTGPWTPLEGFAQDAFAAANLSGRESGELRPCAIRIRAVLHGFRRQDQASEKCPARVQERGGKAGKGRKGLQTAKRRLQDDHRCARPSNNLVHRPTESARCSFRRASSDISSDAVRGDAAMGDGRVVGDMGEGSWMFRMV